MNILVVLIGAIILGMFLYVFSKQVKLVKKFNNGLRMTRIVFSIYTACLTFLFVEGLLAHLGIIQFDIWIFLLFSGILALIGVCLYEESDFNFLNVVKYKWVRCILEKFSKH